MQLTSLDLRHLERCQWVANSRLVCMISGQQKVNLELISFSRVIAVDADGGNLKLLSTRQSAHASGMQLYGGEVLDLLPDEDGMVLMIRAYLPEDHIGSHLGSPQRGLGVDRIDTRTLQRTSVEPPRADAVGYISDGHGNVRIMSLQVVGNSRGQWSGVVKCLYRMGDSREWRELGNYDEINRTGFRPVAIDAAENVALGYEKKAGRLALYKVALDGSTREELVYERPEVDVGYLIDIGRRQRTVGIEYATDRSHVYYFDPAIEALHASLGRALGNQPILRITDSSVDESKLLLIAGSDNDPGSYYLFDRAAKQARPLLAVREPLDGVPRPSNPSNIRLLTGP